MQPELPLSPKRFGGSVRTILAAVFSGILVGVSLLTFPAGVLAMTAVWLGLHTFLVARGKPGWLSPAVCLAILLTKRALWSPAMVLLVFVLAVACLLSLAAYCNARMLPTRVRKAGLVLVWSAWLIAVVDSHQGCHTSHRPVLDRQRPVLCLGDSLTAYGYPDSLAQYLSVPVINMGRDGFSTTDALELLPQIREARPQAVVVELGGHDFLRKHGEDTCRRNLKKIIQECRAIGAEVVLVEIPRGIVTDPFGGLERRLARQHDLELIADTTLRWFVLLGPYAPPGMWLPADHHLSDDGLHPNERGNELLARKVRGALIRVYGDEIAG